jgi:hypothetical protein
MKGEGVAVYFNSLSQHVLVETVEKYENLSLVSWPLDRDSNPKPP